MPLCSPEPAQKSYAYRSCLIRKIIYVLLITFAIVIANPIMKAEQLPQDADESLAAGESDTIAQEEIEDLANRYVEPNAPMTDSSKIRRYELIIAKGQNLLESHPEAQNRHELLSVMLQTAQANSIVSGTAEARSTMLNIAREISASNAPPQKRMRSDALLTYALISQHGNRSTEAGEAVAQFADKYRDTKIEADATMRAMMMAFDIGNKSLFDALEHRLFRDFRDNPEVASFLRDRFGKRIDRTLVNIKLERPGDKGIWRLPMDILGRPVTITFWAAAIDNLELKMRSIKRIYRNNPDDVFLLGINLDSEKEMARKAAERLGLNYPQVYRGQGASDPFFLLFGDATLPSVAYIRPNGHSAAIIKERGRDDIGWAAPMDKEPAALALTFLRSGEFIVTRPVGPTNPKAPPELGTPEKARMAMSKLKGPLIPAETLQSIQECFTVPPRRYRLGDPITGRYDRPDREPAARLYETAIERCEQAIEKHPEAADLFLVRNRLMVALVGLGIIRTDPSLTQRAAEVGQNVLENQDIPQIAKLEADLCVLRWKLREQMDTAIINDRLKAFVARYAGGPREPHAVALASLLALELGDKNTHNEYVHEIESSHRLNQDMRPFLWCMENDNEKGRQLQAEVSLLDGGTLNLPDDWQGQAGAIVFITYSDDPEVMQKRCDHMNKLRLRKLWNRDANQPDKLNVLYAIIGGTHSQVKELAEKRKWPWPVAHSGRGWDDPLAQAYRGPGVQNEYSMLVVNHNGKIIDDRRGFWMNRSFDRTLDKLRKQRKDDKGRDTGRKALAEGNFREAAAAFQGIVDRAGRDRPSVKTCMMLAKSRAGLGQWEEATTWIDRARRFAEDADAGKELLNEIESLQEKFKREKKNADLSHDNSEFIQPDTIEEVMPGSRIIPQWNVVGPFHMIQAETDNHYLSLISDIKSGIEKEWEKSLPPEKSPDLNKTYKDKFGNEATWKEAEVDEKGYLSLSRLYNTDYSIACALSYIHSPQSAEYEVGIGSDDHHLVRVNGRNVHEHYGPRPAELAQDKFKIRLNKGWNEIFVKCGNETGDWGFYVQIVDPDKALSFATKLPEDTSEVPRD